MEERDHLVLVDHVEHEPFAHAVQGRSLPLRELLHDRQVGAGKDDTDTARLIGQDLEGPTDASSADIGHHLELVEHQRGRRCTVVAARPAQHLNGVGDHPEPRVADHGGV